jgi:phospholipid/cholesterol/gamma-HCH transport system substrate-binding protein
MRNKSVELKVGIVVVLAAIIFVWGVIWIKEYEFRQERHTYSVLFPNVGALEVGDPVAVLGVAKGKVEKIQLYQGDVLVTFNLTTDVVLKEDAKFTVMNIGLMGERFIEVETGHSLKPLNLSRPVKGFYDSGIPEVMGMMGEMVTEIRNLTAHLTGALGTEWSEESIKEIVRNLKKISTDLNSLLTENKNRMNQTLEDVSYTSAELKKMVEENKSRVETTMKSFSQASTKLENITQTLDSLSLSLKNLSQKIERGEGTLGQLISDTLLYQDLKQTVKSVDELIQDIKKNPKKYFKFEIF